MTMSTFTFDQTFEALVGTSGGLIVLASFWIVTILIQIEKTKASAFSSVIDEEDENGGGGDLHFEESTAGHIEMTDQPHLEVEKPEQSGSPKSSINTPSSPNNRSPRRRHQQQSPQKVGHVGSRKRRVPWSFVWMQLASVSALVLLAYLVLVVSNAPIALRGLGSVVIFFIFLRFQIGEEIRRQRIDRITLLISLFLVIASMLSLCVYSMKTLKQGEVYEGPARIVGYDMSNYNNTQHDPTTRTDIAVSWGKDWGCPLSGGKTCQSTIQGAMCQVHPEQSQLKHKGGRARRRLEDALEEDLEGEEQENQELESENENLEKENEELEKEIEELKEENEVQEEVVEETTEEATSEIYEVEDEYDAEIMDLEEEDLELDQELEDEEYENDENEKQEDLEQTNDDAVKEELKDEITEDEQDEELVDEEYTETEDEYSEYAEDYEEYADEDYEDAVEAEEEIEDLEDQKDEIEEEVEETESEIDKQEGNNSNHGTSSSSSTAEEEAIEEDEEIVEEVTEAEEEEIVEEYYGDEYEDDAWYWDEIPSGYDDDWYEDEYWNYDWDSVWGEYACEDLFDSDIGTRTFDPNKPAGGDDEWPFVNIYGSCKTCEAYVLDYFAEEAFEELEDYRKQAIIYMSGAIAGLLVSFISYIKYRVMPTAENEIELLGSDDGVLA